MKDTVLLFESRDLCYESNRYFMECIKEALENKKYPVEICDLSVQMEEKLEQILKKKENYLFAVDFNSLLPRMEIEDGTPYLNALGIPFFNYLVDHPLYHHAGLKKQFSGYSVFCIDTCHQTYIKKLYPHIEHVFYLPLGAVQANMERSFDRKRLDLLFLGTYEPEDALYRELDEYPLWQKKEVASLIERMEADAGLTQEKALFAYLEEKEERISREAFAKRLNGDYLADKYLRNLRRKQTVLAAAQAEIPFTVMGHGWEHVKELDRKYITRKNGVGFAASIQIMADAKMLVNATPGFHGGLHDRVYSAMMNRTLCFTEDTSFAKQKLKDREEIVFYNGQTMEDLAESIVFMHENPSAAAEITERAFCRACLEDTWEKRAEAILSCAGKS